MHAHTSEGAHGSTLMAGGGSGVPALGPAHEAWRRGQSSRHAQTRAWPSGGVGRTAALRPALAAAGPAGARHRGRGARARPQALGVRRLDVRCPWKALRRVALAPARLAHAAGGGRAAAADGCGARARLQRPGQSSCEGHTHEERRARTGGRAASSGGSG